MAGHDNKARNQAIMQLAKAIKLANPQSQQDYYNTLSDYLDLINSIASSILTNLWFSSS